MYLMQGIWSARSASCRRSAWMALAATLYLAATLSVQAVEVGFEPIEVPMPDGVTARGGVWYPSTGEAERTHMGLHWANVVRSGPVTGQDLALVVISHGSEGHYTSHADTAAALATYGFVVAAINHPGDNAIEARLLGTRRLLEDRPRHISHVIDFMTRQWRQRAVISTHRIGVFGFSAGGHAALVASGLEPDYRRVDLHCRRFSDEPLCLMLGTNVSVLSGAEAAQADARIRAAVIAAPALGFAFSPASLASLKVPLQVWSASEDNLVPHITNVEPLITGHNPLVSVRLIQGAGHFSFLAPCKFGAQVGSSNSPTACSDPTGFDRVSFKAHLHEEIARFFLNKLPPH